MAQIPRSVTNLLGSLITSLGVNSRVKVDVGQTGFFEGREFRFEYEVS